MTGLIKIPPRTKRVTLEDFDLPDGYVEVNVRMKMGEYLAHQKLIASGEQPPDGISQLVAERLVAWNLAGDDGEPLPLDHEGVKQLDFAIVLHVHNTIWEEIGKVPLKSNAS